MKEIWKTIEEFENYQVSNMGRVKNVKTNHILKLKKMGRGQYRGVGIRNGNIIKYKTIHRLVAETFIPNPDNLPQINHKDENPLNNCVDNLEWCTAKYNANYGNRNKKFSKNRDYNKIASKRKKAVLQYTKDGIFLKRYNSARDFTKEKGLKTPESICNCCNGKYKTAYGYKWRYDNNKYKFFVFSDPHGNYTDTIRCLNEAGYDETNPTHKLICLGDFTDRQRENVELYEYLYRLTKENKAIVLAGNHTLFFTSYLSGKSITPFNYIYNGTNETFADFLHQTAPFETWWALNGNEKYPSNIEFAEWLKEAVNEINTEYPELLSWLENLPRYFETKNYIMVHASIDTEVADWHKPHCNLGNLTDWDALDFDDGSFWAKAINNTDKTVVVGHYHTDGIREKYDLEIDKSLPANQILYGKQKIYIDTCTVLTHRVNVLVIEDELL